MANHTFSRHALGRNPREEPDALTRTSGSVRGAPGNRGPYRDNPLEWLTDILTRLPAHPPQKIHELLPHHWKRQQETAQTPDTQHAATG